MRSLPELAPEYQDCTSRIRFRKEGNLRKSDYKTKYLRCIVDSIMKHSLTLYLLLASQLAFGQSTDSIFDALDLNEVVVSGTRYAYDRSEAPIVVDVIKPQLLQATQHLIGMVFPMCQGFAWRPTVRIVVSLNFA